jgi:hypothetical protein
MRTPFRFLMTIVLMGSACTHRSSFPDGSGWDPKSATFGWWAGEVKLSEGFTYHPGGGLDTFEGRFISRDRKVVVQHDIGGYAGAYASRARASVFVEWIVDGARVWTAKIEMPDHKILMAVTFPDSGCANFILESHTPGDTTPKDFIARSFRPKGRPHSDPGSLCH